MEDKNKQRKEEDEFVNVFKYFENANVRNRDAFSELLNYTIEARKHQNDKRPEDTDP